MPQNVLTAHRAIVAAAMCVLALGGCTTSTWQVPGPTVTATTTHIQTATVTATPAEGGRRAPEACGPLIYGTDGDYGNAICPDGHPNIQAVDAFRQAGYIVIDLDAHATPQQVSAALCANANTLTNPIRKTLYDTAAALNGWNFPQSILDDVGGISCP